jgi:predicted lactoylglutathione lyase
MIGYVSLGTSDLDRAARFYDALMQEIGANRVLEEEGTFIAWGPEGGFPGLMITKPFDANPATAGNGVMVALAAESREQVDRIYSKAIELGASDEGPPGPRGDAGTFYAGYFRDLDGNKLNAFHMG